MERDSERSEKEEKTRTNIMAIREMSVQELASLLSYFSTCDHCVYREEDCMKKIRTREIDCEKGIALWLEQVETHQK